jgi:ABC-type transporter MlaC component
VSLVTNFRTSFATEIKQAGLDSLIQRLEAKTAPGGA